MRKLIISLICIVLLTSTVLASTIKNIKVESMQGVYKKDKLGRIIHYDNNGKKVGVYKYKNGRYIKIK